MYSNFLYKHIRCVFSILRFFQPSKHLTPSIHLSHTRLKLQNKRMLAPNCLFYIHIDRIGYRMDKQSIYELSQSQTGICMTVYIRIAELNTISGLL